jgi:creatinine amidohydrolase
MSTQHLQAELLRPSEIATELAKRSVVYLPLGTIEFHSAHLPIGLDALNAHSVCLAAAQKTGGIVLPPLYYGTGGGHGAYPWTVMIDDESIIRSLIWRTLERLQDFGVQLAVIFTGHFADEQLALISEIEQAWNSGKNSLVARSHAVNMPLTDAPAPDHAGIFETTLISATWPDRVNIDELPDLATSPSIDPDGNPMGLHRHEPTHPLWGIFGPDPRTFDASLSKGLLEKLALKLQADVDLTLP